MNTEPMTTIAVSNRTKDKLDYIGKKGDSYEEIVSRLIDFWQRYGGLVKKEQ